MATDGLQGMCIFDEQGTGKTITALAAFDLLWSKKIIEVLIVVAPKTLIENWRDEAKKFLTHRDFSICIAEGDRSERFLQLNTSHDIYIVTYDNLRADILTYKAIALSRPVALVADESFFVKNPEAIRSIAAMELRAQCKKCFVLCGTPAPNRPTDLIHQFTLADNGYAFGEPGLNVYNDLDSYEKIDTIIAQRGVFLRRTKKSVLPDLPEKHYQIIELNLTPKQRLLYDEAKSELILYLKSLDNRSFKRNLTTYFQKRNALLQICVDPSLIDPLYNEVPCKFQYLRNELSDLIENQGKKVVVWSVYTKTLDKLVADFSKYAPARIDGTITSISERKLMVDKFQNDERCRLFVGNPAAAGAGITLHRSSTAIYISYSNQAAHYMVRAE